MISFPGRPPISTRRGLCCVSGRESSVDGCQRDDGGGTGKPFSLPPDEGERLPLPARGGPLAPAGGHGHSGANERARIEAVPTMLVSAWSCVRTMVWLVGE